MSSGLGFKYSREVSDLVDADEYREFLKSGRMTEDEASYLRQFLFEFYGRPTKAQLKIHDPTTYYTALTNCQHARRRDLVANPESDFTPNKLQANSVYTPADYRKGSSNPEDIYIAKQQYARSRRRRSD